MEAKGDWKAVAGILGRVADAGVSGSEEAARRRDEIRSSRWWLF